ncbi:Flp pilus assembly protein RcpC/CpaB [Nocardioides sp. AX2bis]|nr:Flp pilus assembly protein RcpC/CpaB [Nocardioides sp. AX2bis]
MLLARRRLLAAVLTGLAVLAAVRAVAPVPAPTAGVVVAARDLPAGSTVTADDIEVRTVAAALVPPGTGPPEPAAVVGRVVAGPVGVGEQLAATRLVGEELADAGPGRTTLPVRLADAAAADLLRVGDRVDLVAADLQGGPGASGSPVATGVDVLAVPAVGAGTGDPVGAGGATPPGSLVVVAVDPEEVGALTQASAAGFVTFTWQAP